MYKRNKKINILSLLSAKCEKLAQILLSRAKGRDKKRENEKNRICILTHFNNFSLLHPNVETKYHRMSGLKYIYEKNRRRKYIYM